MDHPIAADACIQAWVDAAAARRPGALADVCAAARDAGLTAIAWHAGPRVLAERWAELAALAADHGLQAVAASGVDGASLTARAKGALLGSVLAEPTCVGLLVDAEGAWDTDTGASDEADEAGAIALGAALRAVAPDKPVGDQPWFAIQSHGDGSPRDPRNPFRGFPADEFAASCVNWCRFRQLYCNDFRGVNRYARTAAWMDADWTQFDADLERAGRADLVRPLGVTLQGYGWRDIVPDLVDALIEYTVRRAQPVFLWCEPMLAGETLAAVRGVHWLVAEGFARADRSSVAAVRAYQRAYNRTATTAARLVVDGRCGLRTLASMGIAVG